MEKIEFTILIPACNEEKTIEIVIQKAKLFIQKNHLEAEILVVNNASTDNTKILSKQMGVKVIDVPKKGYGQALRKGIEVANGQYVIMGDADDSYNFLELDDFVTNLRDGYDIVIGNRYGKKMEKGAMNFWHKYIGTPLLSYLIRKSSKLKLRDINCGLRGAKKESLIHLNCQAVGMEYASEMMIKASKNKLKIIEIPIDFYKDKREGKSHLRTIKDGMRHLKIIQEERIKL